jgi:hypothetical protein
MSIIDTATREAAIQLFTDECKRLESVAKRTKGGMHNITEDDLKRCVEMADSEVYVEFGFHIRDLFV